MRKVINLSTPYHHHHFLSLLKEKYKIIFVCVWINGAGFRVFNLVRGLVDELFGFVSD